MSLALLVTGAAGQLGRTLLARCAGRPDVPFARGAARAELDLTDPFAVRDTLQTWARVVRADSVKHRLVVVNAAAWTAVDDAEAREEEAFAVNAAGPAVLAAACAEVGARLLHLSTDYVFAGDGHEPYDVDDPTDPRTAYGRTKLAGEQAVREVHPDGSWVVRTAWLYGDTGPSFVHTMAALERSRETVDVVDDQVGSPTWTRDLADAVLALAVSDVPAGVLHATNGGSTSWCGLAKAVFEELGADPGRIRATTSAAFPRPAPRPAWSVLSGESWERAGLPTLRPWREALMRAFQEDLGLREWGHAR